MSPAPTLFDRIWAEHKLDRLSDGRDVLFIDRHLVHEVSSPQAFSDLSSAGMKVAYPELTFATVDHIVATQNGRGDETVPGGREMIEALRAECAAAAITLFDVGDDGQGIVHVTMPEQGIIQPGNTVCCGDSHTCTLGALGCMPFTIGTSETTQVLASQTIFRKQPKNMLITVHGTPSELVYPKDIILHIIGRLGVDGAKGFAVEFAGPVVQAMSMEGRFTLCNMASEMGAASAIIGVDQLTLDYLIGKQFTPTGKMLDEAVTYWRGLHSSSTSSFEEKLEIDVTKLTPQITWGTSPDMVCNVDGNVPDREVEKSSQSERHAKSLDYMGLVPASSIKDLTVDVVFIGSCTNARLSDLQAAADVLNGKTIAQNVQGIVIPGSNRVKREAEDIGLSDIFISAGFEWREPGCSMCAALNPDRLKPGQRCVSTSNRNFEGRQGPGGRTHLASPATAAACAIAGRIVGDY